MSRPRAQINKIDKTILTMKYLTKLGLAILGLTMLTIAGCEEEKPMSDGENFVKFSGTTSNHHAPYALGYTRTTMAQTKSCDPARVS